MIQLAESEHAMNTDEHEGAAYNPFTHRVGGLFKFAFLSVLICAHPWLHCGF